jgi:hypothetical protein
VHVAGACSVYNETCSAPSAVAINIEAINSCCLVTVGLKHQILEAEEKNRAGKKARNFPLAGTGT